MIQMDKTPYIKYKNIYVIPTFHSRIEFAKLDYTTLFKVFPEIIGVELPNNGKDESIKGAEKILFYN